LPDTQLAPPVQAEQLSPAKPDSTLLYARDIYLRYRWQSWPAFDPQTYMGPGCTMTAIRAYSAMNLVIVPVDRWSYATEENRMGQFAMISGSTN